MFKLTKYGLLFRGRKISSPILIFLSICFLIYSCRKEIAVEPINSTCTPIPPFPGFGFGYKLQNVMPYYEQPNFSPNNEDEFIFVDKMFTSILYKYNLQTQLKESIYLGNVLYPPRWGKKDWILLNLPDQNIWKIKSDGDSLTQLTFSGGLFHPEWNEESDQFIAFSSSNIMESFIYSSDGSIIDTVNFDVGIASSWQHPNYIVSHSNNIVSIFDVQNNVLVKEYEYTQNHILWGSVIWLDSINLIWSKTDGIFSNDINFSPVNKILPTCNSNLYLIGDINKSKTKLIWNKLTRRLISEDSIEVKSKLVIMNVDGTDEQEIIIP